MDSINTLDDHYKSSIPAGAFSSLGLTHRVQGGKTGRMHVLFSLHEFNYFLILDFAANVKDIREQYALDLEETQSIARALKVKHPYDNAKKKPFPMSTDFLVQLEDKTVARTVKPLKNLTKRVIEKFEIERVYWEKRDVEWGIVTEEQIPKNLVETLTKFREYYLLSIPNELILRVQHEWISLWNGSNTFTKHVKDVAHSLRIEYNECYKIVLHLLARKKLHFNHSFIFSDTLSLNQAHCHVRDYQQRSV